MMKRKRKLTIELKPNWKQKVTIWSAVGLGGLLMCASPNLMAKDVVNDTGITRSIEGNMRAYDGISAHLIDVSTEDGVVTLSGYVDNLLARDQAVTLAKSIKGVKSVINRVRVRPVFRTDEQIKDDLTRALSEDAAADTWGIQVKVMDGKVTLSGTADSWQERRLSGQIAKGVRGVKEVVNDVVFVPVANRPDNEIAADVKERLKMDIRYDDSGTKVEVDNGKVTLSGIVTSSDEKTLAEELAQVTGVKSVDADDLLVDYERMASLPDIRTKQPDISDQKIAHALTKTFQLDPRVKAFGLDPMVSDGNVTLDGTVDNYFAKLAANRDAHNTVGVKYVVDLLKVRPKPIVDDQTLKARVDAALNRDPYLDLDDVHVAVRNSEVTLSGQVNNTFEISEAYQATARVNGVADINNKLTATGAKVPANGIGYTWYHYVPDAYWPFDDIPTSLDAKIKSDVKSELFWSPFIDSDQIKVSVNNGRVTLSGFVDDYVERRLATKNAWEGGARGVLNHLTVR